MGALIAVVDTSNMEFREQKKRVSNEALIRRLADVLKKTNSIARRLL